MTQRIRDLDPAQRPRERLLDRGARALSDAELLAVLIRSGRHGHGALEQAQELLSDAGGVDGVARLEAAALARRPGLGPAKAAAIAAAFELGRRLASVELRRAERLDCPDAAGAFLVRLLAGQRQEVFGFLALDAHHHLLRDHPLTHGTSRQAPADPAELLRAALLDDATEVLAYHNHPSGELEPSRDDLQLTRRLAQAGAATNLPLVDHILVAGSRWLSLRRRHPELFAAP